MDLQKYISYYLAPYSCSAIDAGRFIYLFTLGLVAQSVASLTADPGVMSLIPVRSHTFVDILIMK